MKNSLKYFSILSLFIILHSCSEKNNTPAVEVVKDVNTQIKDTLNIGKKEKPKLSWSDSIAQFSILHYTEMLDSNLYRNNNSRKMFCAKPRYTRCQDKKWKSGIVVDTVNNYILYQTTNGDEEYKVMGYGYDPDYHEEETEDTVSFVKMWKLNDSVNLIAKGENEEIGGYNNHVISMKFYEHSEEGFIDQTKKYLPKVVYEDFLRVSLDSAQLETPPYLPLTYNCSGKNYSIFSIEFNSSYVDKEHKYGKEYDWIEDYHIMEKYSVDPDSWKPTLYFELIDGKFNPSKK